VGNIPMEYYDEYDHIGYNIQGKKIARPQQKDELDKLLDKEENKDYWRTVFDTINQKEVVLSKEDYDLVKSIIKGRYPTGYNPEEAERRNKKKTHTHFL
jgi:ribosome biogenesis protein ERB1